MPRKQKSFILPPTDGVAYFLDQIYLSNLKGDAPPEGKPVEFYIFVTRLGPQGQRRSVETISAGSEDEALDQLKAFASRSDVTLVEERTHKPIPKEWLNKETA
jgi:hypothetical protein